MIELKILPEYFEAQRLGLKKFEIRKNDHNFQVGNKIKLREWDEENRKYTGRELQRTIDYITSYAQKEGYVVFGTREAATTDTLPDEAIFNRDKPSKMVFVDTVVDQGKMFYLLEYGRFLKDSRIDDDPYIVCRNGEWVITTPMIARFDSVLRGNFSVSEDDYQNLPEWLQSMIIEGEAFRKYEEGMHHGTV